MTSPIAAAALAALMLTAAAGSYTPATSPTIAAAVADPARTPKDVAADTLRKPAETLAFAGVRPGMSVVEMYPGGGYYTRLLSDVVGPHGHVLGVENAGWDGAVSTDRAAYAALGRANVSLDAKPLGQLSVPHPVDLVWVSQNYHDLKVPEFSPVDVAAFNRSVFQALVPGGTYIVIDHQGAPGASPAQIGKLHRIDRAQVIQEVTAAGFRLVAEGDFLRRVDDDHTRPIFDLKGRTDQFALRFVK